MTNERLSASGPGACRRLLGGVLAVFLGWVTACEAPSSGDPVGSNTNWLVACDDSADCGSEAACVCGACTLECAADADCASVRGARCARTEETAVRSQCRTSEPALSGGMCLFGCEPGSCPTSQACVGGACVALAPPEGELCAALPAPDAAAQGREDRLLALVQGLRTAGGVECGAAAASAMIAELRWEPRLACAARALAADMARTRNQSLVDAAGRDTRARLTLVGYSPALWGEAFALVPGDEGAALDAMLSDADSCNRFVNASFVEVGVGNAEDAYVVTIASE
jgi:uncharacterized protein YkwD